MIRAWQRRRPSVEVSPVIHFTHSLSPEPIPDGRRWPSAKTAAPVARKAWPGMLRQATLPMDAFIKDFLPAIILLAVFSAHFLLLVFKPRMVDRIVLTLFVGSVPVAGWPESRFGFVCFGSLWGIAGLGVLLNGFGFIASKTVPFFFLAGFLVACIGVIHSLFVFRSHKHRKKHRR